MMSAKIATKTPLVITVMGLPGAGKTHTATQLAEKLGAFHLEADEIRATFFETPMRNPTQDGPVNALVFSLTERLMEQGLSLVLDVSSNTLVSRRRIYELARKYGYSLLSVWVQTDKETAYMRVSSRDRRRRDDKFAVELDRASFDRLTAELRSPEREEYVVVSGKHAFKSQYATVLRKLAMLRLLVDPFSKNSASDVSPMLMRDIERRRRLSSAK